MSVLKVNNKDSTMPSNNVALISSPLHHKLWTYCPQWSSLLILNWQGAIYWLFKLHLVLTRKIYRLFSCGLFQTLKWLWSDNRGQKQPSRVVLRKTWSENVLPIYMRTPTPKCDLNKIALQLYWNHRSAWALSCKFPAYFQNTFL